MNTSYSITDGPSKWEILEAFAHAYDESFEIPIKFDVQVPQFVDRSTPDVKVVPATRAMRSVRIVSIAHEDGSGNSFNLKGHCTVSLDNRKPVGKSTPGESFEFCGRYNAKTRKGIFEFSKK